MLVAAVVWLSAARPVLGQHAPKRIGYLHGGRSSANAEGLQAFRDALRELGHIEGRDVVIEPRWAEGHLERLPELAAELVHLPVTIIVAAGDPVVTAVRNATATIPIVMTSVGDPLGRGFIESFARPGGNVTGVSNFSISLVGKWLELLKAAVPGLSHVAVLRNPANATHALFWHEAQDVAPRLGIAIEAVDVAEAEDIERAFTMVREDRAGAVLVLPDPLLAGTLTRRIVELGLEQRVGAMCTFREQAVLGCLLSYGPDPIANYRRAAFYVDRILKGAKPADLPVEQPSRFVSILNARTANALGLVLSSELMLRVDELVS